MSVKAAAVASVSCLIARQIRAHFLRALSTCLQWEYECDRWLPQIAKVVYDGDKDRRRYLRENFIKPGHFNIVMTTFEFAMRDKTTLRKIPWAYIIIDE